MTTVKWGVAINEKRRIVEWGHATILRYCTSVALRCGETVTAVSLHQRQRWRSPSVSVFVVCNANAVQLRNSAVNLVGPHPSGSCLVNATPRRLESYWTGLPGLWRVDFARDVLPKCNVDLFFSTNFKENRCAYDRKTLILWTLSAFFNSSPLPRDW